MTRPDARRPPKDAPKPAEEVRRPDPNVPGEDEHARISRQDHEKARPANSGREGA